MRPTPAAHDWMDNLELSHGRLLMLFQVEADNLDDPPKLLLEEFDSPQAVDDLGPGGSVWLYPEDIPRLISWLEERLQSFRNCARIDREKSPPRYWGDLDRHGETPKIDVPGDV